MDRTRQERKRKKSKGNYKGTNKTGKGINEQDRKGQDRNIQQWVY